MNFPEFDYFDSGTSTIRTDGGFPTEAEACARFDLMVNKDMFSVYPECRGQISQPRHGTEQFVIYIDRLLIPTAKAVSAGWSGGCIGVEIKKSDTKIGKPVSQAMDYMRAVYDLPNSGISVVIGSCFLFPLRSFGNEIESVMSQHRIGGAYINGGCEIAFKLSSTNVLKMGGGKFEVNHQGLFNRYGRKVGSR